MAGDGATFECARCGTVFDSTANHTEIVRRDFAEVPQPSKIERLCLDCWQAYVEEFLDADFEAALAEYERDRSDSTGPKVS